MRRIVKQFCLVEKWAGSTRAPRVPRGALASWFFSWGREGAVRRTRGRVRSPYSYFFNKAKRFLAVSIPFFMAINGHAANPACFNDALARAASAKAVAADGGWLYLTAELRFLSLGEFWGEASVDTGMALNPAHRDPLEPIDDFNRQLEDLGIRLLVVPVPPKALIYPAPLGCSREDTRESLERLRAFYAVLHDHGVAVLDLTEDFLKPEALAEGKLYCMTDSRWSGIGIKRAATRINEWLAGLEDIGPALRGEQAWNLVPRTQKISGDLSHLLKRSDEEDVEVVETQNEQASLATTSPDSPVLLLGDSHALIFHEGGELYASNAGLSDHLAALLGRPIDVVGVKESGATASRLALMRHMNASSDYIKAKKVVIWCFSVSEFTEAESWRFVPLPLH